LEKIRGRVERRKYNQLTDQVAGFSNRRQYQLVKEKEDYRFVLAFGLGFISLTFMGFLSGYCLGRFVLDKSEEFSLILSLVTGILTLIVEMLLMIIRLYKWEHKRV
jgi:hypothetical protein